MRFSFLFLFIGKSEFFLERISFKFKKKNQMGLSEKKGSRFGYIWSSLHALRSWTAASLKTRARMLIRNLSPSTPHSAIYPSHLRTLRWPYRTGGPSESEAATKNLQHKNTLLRPHSPSHAQTDFWWSACTTVEVRNTPDSTFLEQHVISSYNTHN